MVDVFQEVEEELRTEKYKQWALKFGPWVLGGLLSGAIIIGGVYGYGEWRKSQIATAASAYDAALKTLGDGDLETGFTQMGKVPKSSAAYRTLALMSQGAVRLEQGKNADAAKLFDEAAKVAPGGKYGVMLSDAARLKSALALIDEAPYADTEARLKPLIAEGRPYASMAREALALAMLNAGKTVEARAEFTRLTTALDAPEGMTQRARAAVSMIDSGAAKSIPAVVKAAKDVPPPQASPMQLTPEMIQQMIQQQQGGAQ